MTDEFEALKETTRKTAEMLFGGADAKGGQAAGAYELWKAFDPELAKHISMFYVGRLYSRDVISQKQRELCAVAALTTLDRKEELRAHIRAAMNVGATREEVAEVIFQMATYAGVPVVVEGLRVLKEVLDG
jgi:4-carboxymuconolactone decarboxylase